MSASGGGATVAWPFPNIGWNMSTMACNTKKDTDGSLILDVDGKVKTWGKGKMLMMHGLMGWNNIKDQINIGRKLNADMS